MRDANDAFVFVGINAASFVNNEMFELVWSRLAGRDVKYWLSLVNNEMFELTCSRFA